MKEDKKWIRVARLIVSGHISDRPTADERLGIGVPLAVEEGMIRHERATLHFQTSSLTGCAPARQQVASRIATTASALSLNPLQPQHSSEMPHAPWRPGPLR